MAFPIAGPRFGPVERDGGPACCVSLSDPADSPFWWSLALDVLLEDWMRIGVLRTLPLAGPFASPYSGAGSARAIATAYVPGARGYRLSGLAEGPPGFDVGNARAEIALTVGLPGDQQRQGLSRVNAWEDGAQLARPPETSAIAVAPGPAVLVAPDDAFRVRLVLVSQTADVWIGAAGVTPATGLRVPVGVPFNTTTHRAIYAASLAAAVLSTWREGS